VVARAPSALRGASRVRTPATPPPLNRGPPPAGKRIGARLGPARRTRQPQAGPGLSYLGTASAALALRNTRRPWRPTMSGARFGPVPCSTSATPWWPSSWPRRTEKGLPALDPPRHFPAGQVGPRWTPRTSWTRAGLGEAPGELDVRTMTTAVAAGSLRIAVRCATAQPTSTRAASSAPPW